MRILVGTLKAGEVSSCWGNAAAGFAPQLFQPSSSGVVECDGCSLGAGGTFSDENLKIPQQLGEAVGLKACTG